MANLSISSLVFVATLTIGFSQVIYNISPCSRNTFQIFGSGYTDDGVTPPTDVYGLHKYSTGKVWTEILGETLGYKVLNYAVAGASTGMHNVYYPNWGGLMWQVRECLRLNGRIPSNVIVGFETGAINELLFGRNSEAEIQAAVNNASVSLTELLNAGAQVIFTLNVPDYTLVPAFAGPTPLENATNLPGHKAIVANHNQKYATMINNLQQRYPQARLIQIDFQAIFAQSTQSYQYRLQWGFQYGPAASQPYPGYGIGTALPADVYLTGNAQPDDMLKYAFYDAFHPASGPHRDFAAAILQQLQAAGIVGGGSCYYGKK